MGTLSVITPPKETVATANLEGSTLKITPETKKLL